LKPRGQLHDGIYLNINSRLRDLIGKKYLTRKKKEAAAMVKERKKRRIKSEHNLWQIYPNYWKPVKTLPFESE